jgi:hypothetical protein
MRQFSSYVDIFLHFNVWNVEQLLMYTSDVGFNYFQYNL